MQISPISFGKVIKVQAPMRIVNELAALANSKKQTAVAKDLKTIFDDRKDGKVESFSRNGTDNYLLSGEDSMLYGKYREMGTNFELIDNHMKLINIYAAQHASGYMTVAHDGKTVKAIDIVK